MHGHFSLVLHHAGRTAGQHVAVNRKDVEVGEALMPQAHPEDARRASGKAPFGYCEKSVCSALWCIRRRIPKLDSMPMYLARFAPTDADHLTRDAIAAGLLVSKRASATAIEISCP
jgi:hypothetical protein